MKTKILLLFLLPFLLGVSCKKQTELNCDKIDIDFIPISFIESCIPIIVDKKYEDKFFVIQSLDELQKILTFQYLSIASSYGNDSEIFKVDFNKHTLIIGKKWIGQTYPTLINQTVNQDCDGKLITYSLNVRSEGFAALSNFVFAVLINKISAETKVNFDIKVKPATGN